MEDVKGIFYYLRKLPSLSISMSATASFLALVGSELMYYTGSIGCIFAEGPQKGGGYES